MESTFPGLEIKACKIKTSSYYSLYTTITISAIRIREETKKTPQFMNPPHRETHEEVIEGTIEDISELNEETRAEIEESRNEIESGKFITP